MTYLKLSGRRGCRAMSAICALAAVALFASTSRAQAVPTFNHTTPVVLQRGQSIEISLPGQHLARVDDLVIANARGLQASLIRPQPTTQPATQPSEKPKLSDTELKLTLSADSDASLGDRELRLVSPTGVSAPLHVTVSQFPHIEEKEPNNVPDQAQEIQFPAALTGKMDAPGDIDCFRFSGRRGEHVIFDVHASRSSSPLDPVVTIHDAAGHELATKVDYHGGDPTVIFQPAADGQYEMEIRDLEFRGGDDFFYRIDAGPIPYVQALTPLSAQPGKVAEVQAVGINLQGLERIPLDLTYAATGRVGVRARAEAGLSNEVPFDISELPAYVERGENHGASQAEAVPFPIEITGHIDQAGDEDFFKFHVEHKQLVTIEAVGRRLGSPIDALLTLRNAKGNAIVTNDDAGGPDARISRDLEPGDYIASVRDLTYHGGPNYAYRLRIAPGTSESGQDFAVRFLPDALRVSRGGNAVVMCDVQRTGGFKGDVTVTLEGLPPGVTSLPVVLAPNASDIFTVSAAPGAVLGTYPIQLRATATIDNHFISKLALPMLGAGPTQQAYLTVMDAAPFTIEALTGLSPQRIQQLYGETDTLAKKLNAPNPQIEPAQAAWEKRVAAPLVWESLDAASATAAQGTQFKRLPDGSFLATGNNPANETYTVTASTHLSGITAIRLEVRPDDSLPEKGPGRHGGDGNFVLSHFTVSAAPESQPEKKTPVALHSPRAILEQNGYPVIDAIEPKPGKGWAMYPYKGKANAAWFFTQSPLGDGSGTLLTFTLDHQFGNSFNIGRFRLSVTTDPDAQAKAGLPRTILDLVQMPADQRNAKQKQQLAMYYRGIDPQYGAESQRLETLYKAVSPYAEIARLDAALKADSPQFEAGRATWEKQVMAGHAWVPLDLVDAKSAGGATLMKQPDQSVLVSGLTPDTDVYTLVANAPIKGITALRIEAIPDARLPGNGPGRAPNGNFVLTKLNVRAAPKGTPMGAPVEFRGASASAEQQGFRAIGAIDDRDDTGWAVMPTTGAPSIATFYPAEPIAPDGNAQLTIELEHKFAGAAQHSLGHFRIWITSNPNPDSAQVMPMNVLAVMRVAADKRDRQQKDVINTYYRSASPQLEPLRYRLAELKAETTDATTHAQYRQGTIPLLVSRNNFAGEVRVTLEGFSAGRKRPIEGNLKFEPLRVPANAMAGALTFTVEPAAETGTKLAVLKAEAKIGDETYVEYTPAFPLTVTPAR